jgi:carbamoyltransferase
LFGDSFTAGDGVSNGKRYGDILENTIPDLEVYNFGLPATGTDQQYLTYQEFAGGIDHDLMVIAVFLENIRRVISHYRYFKNEKGETALYSKPYFELDQGKLQLKNAPVQKLPIKNTDLPSSDKNSIYRSTSYPIISKFAEKIGVKKFVQKYTRYQPSPEYNRPDHPAWILMKAILENWICNHPKPVLLMVIPQDHYIRGLANPSSYQARFKEIAYLTKCTFFDPLPDLMKYPLEERESFRLQDFHYSEKGHMALAKSMKPVVEVILNTKI